MQLTEKAFIFGPACNYSSSSSDLFAGSRRLAKFIVLARWSNSVFLINISYHELDKVAHLTKDDTRLSSTTTEESMWGGIWKAVRQNIGRMADVDKEQTMVMDSFKVVGEKRNVEMSAVIFQCTIGLSFSVLFIKWEWMVCLLHLFVHRPKSL